MDDVTLHIDELVLGSPAPPDPESVAAALWVQLATAVPPVLVEAAARAITGSVVAAVPERPR
jgi:hypothetical protein